MSSHAGEASGDADAERQVTFTIKASNDQKFVLTQPVSTTISALKEKLSASEYAAVPAERIRLIYSGRVLKDADTLATYKVVDGNTIHMVKGAASNARQNPATRASSGSPAPVPAVPQMAAGTGNNPLAGLTGARYAGFHGLPNASMFGSDGGMGAPPGPEEMLRMLEDPNFAQMFNESMNNPAVIQMLEQQPMIAQNPMLRNMIRNPEMRRMLFNPEMLRMQLQMQRSMGGGAAGGAGAFPMPGATDTTPQNQQVTQQQGTNPPAAQTGWPPQTGFPGGAQGNPFAMPGNPFAALFGQPPATGATGTTPATSPPAAASAGGQGTPAAGTDAAQQPPNPFANLFGGQAPPPGGAPGGQGDIWGMAQQMMQNPEFMRSMFGGNDPTQAGAGTGANPFGAMFNPAMFGMPPQAPEPADDRPPEVRYENQLRQLNDMGFYEFERNVQALRRSGGSVQGAIEFLLGGGS